MRSDQPQPIFVAPHDGKNLDFLSVSHRLTGQQTSGTFYAFESVLEPGDGNRLHVHRREDELGYVLEGALEIRLADQTLLFEAGSIAYLPKNIPHAIRNPLETTSRYLFLAIPAGLDELFDALDAARQNGTLDDEMHRKLSLDYGLEWLE